MGRGARGSQRSDHISRFDATGWECRAAGEVNGFDPCRVLGKKLADRSGRFIQFAVAASVEAWEHAQLGTASVEPPRVQSSLARRLAGSRDLRLAHRFGGRGTSARIAVLHPEVAHQHRRWTGRDRARRPGLNGCPATACAASVTHGQAGLAIATGQADVAVAGGSEATIAPLTPAGFQKMRVLSTWQGDVASSSRPFSKDRTGMVVSEGAGVLVLEALDHALARGTRSMRRWLGSRRPPTPTMSRRPLPVPKGPLAAWPRHSRTRVFRAKPWTTSTRMGRGPWPTMAMRPEPYDRYSARRGSTLVSSTKGATGHLLGASGGMEAVITVCALRDGLAPPTLNLDVPDPDCDLDYVANTSREAPLRVALSNAFGLVAPTRCSCFAGGRVHESSSGCNHGGVELKQAIGEHLRSHGHDVTDVGTWHRLRGLSRHRPSGGIRCLRDHVRPRHIGLRDGTRHGDDRQQGIGCSGSRGVGRVQRGITLAHNDARVLCLGQRVLGTGLALHLVDVWMASSFKGSRHSRRVGKMEPGSEET